MRGTVLHVLPVDLPRGAQTYARALRDILDEPARPHRTMTLFASPPVALHADIELGVRPGLLRRVGFDPRAARALRRTLAADPPDLVIAHGSEPFLYGAVALPARTRFVYYRIGIANERLRNPLRRALYRAALRRTDLVAGVSDETLEDAHRVLGVSESILRLVPNGREPDRFLGPRHPTEPGQRPRLVWVSHLAPHKRPELFVAAAAELRRRGHQFDAAGIGGGEPAPTLVAQAADAGVELLGRRDDVPEQLLASDIFCFTSAGENEGMPGVLIEAGLAGLPVVTTEVAGARTVIDDGVTGLVVSVDGKAPLVDGLEQLLKDPTEREAMGERARQRCLERFTLEASTTRWREVIDELLGNGIRPRP